jgi:NADH-ubiquinone oxidoreductase chain 5
LILVAAITKRAQIPFSAWLPAAIAAPTPVSALVHSSTLVTAGIYLLVRFNFAIYSWFSWIIWVGAITTVIAGLAALIELDIKKIIALSTLRQLGIIIFTLGLGEPGLCWLHLIRHAYFKAILFIGAGSIIHTIKDYQDLRKIGSWAKRNQFISRIYIRGSMRLCGMPFLRGFFSKDSILEQILINEISLITLIIIFFSTFFTAVYSLRIVTLLFKINSLRESFSKESIRLGRIRAGILPLTIYSIVGGWILFRFFNPDNLVILPVWLKLRILVGIFTFRVIFFLLPNFIFPKNIFYSGLHQIWFLPLVVSPVLSRKGMKFSKLLFKQQEVSWLIWLLIKVTIAEKNKFYLSSILNSKVIIYLTFLLLINLIILI